MKQYRQRVSGPLLDRIDIQVEVPRLSDTGKAGLLQQGNHYEPDSASIREQVVECRARQLERCGVCNAKIPQHDIRLICALSAKDKQLLADAMNRLRFSARVYFRILKIARTIADLAGKKDIATGHLMEAINYRRFDAS